tara:strand:- start:143 stop:778 length:636 start_codon:yes stop_codon:yes gene_type:complete
MKEEKAITNILFDWSGVISDDVVDVYIAASQVFRHSGVEPISLAEFRREIDMPFRHFYEKFLPGLDLEECQEVFGKNHSRNPRIYAGIKEILRFLHHKKIEVGILSGHPQEFLDAEIRYHGLGEFFDPRYVYGGVHDKIEVAEDVLQNNGFKKDNTAYIGDLIHDLKTGRSLGVFTVASLYGWTPADKLREQDADMYISHPLELHRLITKS